MCVPPTTVLEVCHGPHTSRGLLKVNVAFRVHSSANESRNNNVLEGQSCRVASLSTTHKKTRRGNKRRTCFPDVSVWRFLPDSRRRWILNKRILAMEDEAIAHFYVWSFKHFHISPSGDEERAKHRGKRERVHCNAATAALHYKTQNMPLNTY